LLYTKTALAVLSTACGWFWRILHLFFLSQKAPTAKIFQLVFKLVKGCIKPELI